MSLFANVKHAVDVKAAIRDQSGQTIKVDLREDEESKEKYGQIIDLLLAAGYFRARISTLPPFDKVVGGLVWGISTCNVDLDVDLLYQENSTIGQKIALTEKIVAVLPQMKCPHELQPHQIQGLDCVKIFPVVQWLVKKAMEYREETAQFIRSYSEMMFDHDYLLPCDRAHQAAVSDAYPSFKVFLDSCQPNRIYKKPSNTKNLDIKLQAQSTLLEYGNIASLLEVSFSELEEGRKEQGGATLSQAEQEAETQRELNESNIRKLLKNLAASEESREGDRGTVSQAVGSMLQVKNEAITKAQVEYEEKQAKIFEETNKREALIRNHERIMKALRTEIAKSEDMIAKNTQVMLEMRETYGEMSEDVENLQEKIDLATDKIKELEATHEMNISLTPAEKKKLESLIKEHERVVKGREEYKKTCTDSIKEYKNNLAEVESKITKLENDKRAIKVSQQHNKDKAKLDKLRLQVAKKNYNISALQRQVDEIPSRIELLQYQKRFEELHEQTGKVHTQTKQFYTLFNNLSDTKTYLEKHLIRLNSINENFRKVVGRNTDAAAVFLTQFEQLVAAAKHGRSVIEKKRDEVKGTKDSVNDEYLKLVERQRQYALMVKNFQEECRRSEKLVAKCKAAGVKV